MIEYLVMGKDSGRKTYFKKENNQLTKIKYREYKQATKPEKRSRSRKLPEQTDSESYEKIIVSDSSSGKTKQTKQKKKHNDDNESSSSEEIIFSNESTNKKKSSAQSASGSSDSSSEKVNISDESIDDKKKKSSSAKKAGATKTRRRKSHKSKNLPEKDNESMQKITSVLTDLISRKDRISEILGSSFSNESLGIYPGNSVITPSFPMSSISSNTEPSVIPEASNAAPEPQIVGGTIPPPASILKEGNVPGPTAPEESLPESLETDSFHYLSRTAKYANGITRFPVTDDFVLWDTQYEDYLPVEYSQKHEGDADPDDITKINHAEFTDGTTRPYRYGALHYAFDHSGRPLNPYGRTGLRGKGSFLYWGPNWYVFPLFVRRHKNIEKNKQVIELMVLNENTKFFCAMPTCATKDFSTIAISQKLDISLKKCKLNEDTFISDDKLINTIQLYIDSEKNTDNSWAMACGYVYNVGSALIESDCISWVPLDSFDKIKNDMDPEHYQIILELIGEGGIDIDPVEPEPQEVVVPKEEPKAHGGKSVKHFVTLVGKNEK